ncbi:MAG: flagellar assembly protein FliX [Micropepsaceae bacterium]
MFKFDLTRATRQKGIVQVMKVDGSRPIDNTRMARARAATSSGAAFAPTFAEDSKPATSVSGTRPLSGVDALIALQEMPDPLSQRAKAARRGRDMLDLLDEVRVGLIEGQVSRGTLQRLLSLVNARREDFIDPNLSQVMDEIDLRARVELAKLNFAGAQ